jgi:hypothetical protein
MLMALMGGEALTATELALEAAADFLRHRHRRQAAVTQSASRRCSGPNREELVLG